jgi:predicted RNA-binding protein YlqC (UPF0109 family)
MQKLVEQVAKALVDQPEAVEVESRETEGILALRLKVATADLGKIIGRQGRTARSIRVILGAAALKRNQRCTLDIAE